MKIQTKRTLNYKNCYILFISFVACLSLVGNMWQNHFFTSAIDTQQSIIATYQSENTTVVADHVEDNEELQINK